MATKLPAIAASVLVFSFAASASHAAFVQQGLKLTGSDEVVPTRIGYSVALSSDGSTALAGGIADNTNVGAAWAYTRTGGVWSQQGLKLVGTGAVNPGMQGSAVALSADGNTALVGGYQDNSDYVTLIGAAWVYTRSAGVWSQQGSKLVGTGGGLGLQEQGVSVALSADGNTALVGGDTDNGATGAVWVFTRSAGVWSQQGTKLVGTGFVGFSYQGISVGLSADGNTAIVGGYTDNTNVGAAWIFVRSGSVWSQQGAKLVGTGAVGNANQGYGVAISGDGNTALVGGYGDNGLMGATWVFTRSGTVWSQQGAKLVGTGATGTQAAQGYSVSLSSDGNTALIGGWFDHSLLGAAWVFTRSAGVWTQQGSKLVGTGAVPTSGQGFAVALSADASTAIVGGPNDNGSTGAAWVYSQSPPLAVPPSAPVAFALEGARPNPASGSGLDVAFALPTGASASLELLDVSGRRVLSREVGPLGAGRHTIHLAEGHRVAPGLYWVRLAQGGNRSARRVAVIE